jgi:hypothetical protein
MVGVRLGGEVRVQVGLLFQNVFGSPSSSREYPLFVAWSMVFPRRGRSYPYDTPGSLLTSVAEVQ